MNCPTERRRNTHYELRAASVLQGFCVTTIFTTHCWSKSHLKYQLDIFLSPRTDLFPGLETVEVVLKRTRRLWVGHVVYTEWIAIESQNKHWHGSRKMERESVEDRESPGVTHCQRTCKIPTWHGTTWERSQTTGHCGRTVSPNARRRLAGHGLNVRSHEYRQTVKFIKCNIVLQCSIMYNRLGHRRPF